MKSLLFFVIVFSDFLIFRSTETNVASYNFVLQWPNAYCNTQERLSSKTLCKRPVPQKFTVHGIWPSDQTGASIKYCPTTHLFDPSKLKKDARLWSNMQREWPNLIGDDIDFWRHEWDVHGTCSNMDPLSYFKFAIRLKNQIDYDSHLYQALYNEGITPSESKVYEVHEIASVIFIRTQLFAEVKCNENHKGDEQLHELRFCVSVGEQFINCSDYGFIPRGCKYDMSQKTRLKSIQFAAFDRIVPTQGPIHNEL